MRRDVSVKIARLTIPLCAVALYASLALAQTATPLQNSAGSGSEDVASSNYQAKTAVGDPGVSESQSANYIYDHGTLWFDDGYSELPPVHDPEPTPTGGGSGGNSGSGWLGSLFGGGEEIGGVSPAVDVPFTDTPAAEAVIAAVPRSENPAVVRAVRMADAPQAVEYAVRNPQPVPQVIRIVDEAGVTREINIVLFKRIVPWPLWVAFAVIALGAAVLLAFMLMRGAQAYLLWVGGVCIMLGVIGGIAVRFAYRAAPIDTKAITSINIVPDVAANDAVKRLMADLPLGVHVVKSVDAVGKPTLTVKVFITPKLPI